MITHPDTSPKKQIPSRACHQWQGLFLALCMVILISGCSHFPTKGGLHSRGERRVITRAFGASPLTGKAIFWHGNGNAPNYGVGVQNYWFLNDRLALGAGLNLLNFDASGANVKGVEFEGRMRYHMFEIQKFGFFWELNGGYMYTENSVPPSGTPGNYTFSFGPGVEMPLSEDSSILLGAEFHHMSNARGRNTPINPSQNEILIWLGHSLKW